MNFLRATLIVQIVLLQWRLYPRVYISLEEQFIDELQKEI